MHFKGLLTPKTKWKKIRKTPCSSCFKLTLLGICFIWESPCIFLPLESCNFSFIFALIQTLLDFASPCYSELAVEYKVKVIHYLNRVKTERILETSPEFAKNFIIICHISCLKCFQAIGNNLNDSWVKAGYIVFTMPCFFQETNCSLENFSQKTLVRVILDNRIIFLDNWWPVEHEFYPGWIFEVWTWSEGEVGGVRGWEWVLRWNTNISPRYGSNLWIRFS